LSKSVPPAGWRAILDAELASFDADSLNLFAPLLFGRRIPCLVAFDLLWLDGEGLRDLSLLERKRRLRRLIRAVVKRACSTSSTCVAAV